MKIKYTDRQRIAIREAYNIGFRMAWQRCCDAVAVSLRNADIIGRVVPVEKIITAFQEAAEYDYEHRQAFDHRGKESGEAAYQRELRDRDMREIYGEKAVPFEKRYPETKDIKWGG